MIDSCLPLTLLQLSKDSTKCLSQLGTIWGSGWSERKVSDWPILDCVFILEPITFDQGGKLLCLIMTGPYGFFTRQKDFLTKIRGRVSEQEKEIDVHFINSSQAETGLAQWIEPADSRVPGSILIKCMYLGCRHTTGGVQEAAGQ
uniref:Uncharacterized protein n=1 Tax=Pipistrellus kuhlii TaxID=59472 RepID=A0A7J7WD41_PIPKU|nr:hypothetical protein mPipKuh1_008028 [Pipistrellus kuhlii]